MRGATTTYSVAQSTASSYDNDSATTRFGQNYIDPNYFCDEAFLSFDSSSVGAGSTVTTATLSLYITGNYSTTDFIIEARIRDWGASLTTDDWVAGASLHDYTRVASKSTSGISEGAYLALTSDAAFLSNVDQDGTTYLVVHSDRQYGSDGTGTQPSGNEYVGCYAAENTGTDCDPKLYVEWTEAGEEFTAEGAGTLAFTGSATTTVVHYIATVASVTTPTVTFTGAAEAFVPPTVTIWPISAITDESAMSGGTIVSSGAAAVTERGVCWNATGSPTLADPHTHD